MATWSHRLFVAVKWLFVALVSLVLVTAAAAYALVASVDPAKLPERHGRVQTTLYAADGAARPLIVALGGAEGGNAWTSARWKAQRERFLEQGYAFLAIGYFGARDTPAELDRIALEGVHDAIADAARDPRVDGRCVAIMGGSKGAELALALASRYDDITAAVGIVPANAVFPAHTLAMATSSLSFEGREVPFVPMPWSATPALLRGDLRGAFELMLADEAAVERAAIEVERINGPVLLLSATRDEMWPSREMSDAIMRRLEAHDFAHHAQHVPVEGGHAEPLDRFDAVEDFLAKHFRAADGAGCKRPQAP